MRDLARKDCRDLPVIQAYRVYLNQQGLREATRKGYASLAIDRFHRWIEEEGLAEVNHFRDIRARLEFTVSRFDVSLRRCHEVL